jgi:hypothetical protein
MTIVMKKCICHLCKSEYEEADRSQMSDKEYYLTFWHYELGTPEAEEAWKQKQSMTKREAPMVASDISGYISQVDGSWIESRSKHRDHLKRHGMIELGNDVPTKTKDIEISRKSQEQRKRAIAEVAYEKLRYR